MEKPCFPAEAAWAHGGLAQFRVLNRKLIVAARPDHVQHILLDNVNNYIKSFHYRSIARFVGPGIIFSDGELWRERRRQVQPAFNKVFLKSLVDVVNEECVQAMDRWDGILKEEPYLNVAVEARTLALRVITRALLGIELENAQARTLPGGAVWPVAGAVAGGTGAEFEPGAPADLRGAAVGRSGVYACVF